VINIQQYLGANRADQLLPKCGLPFFSQADPCFSEYDAVCYQFGALHRIHHNQGEFIVKPFSFLSLALILTAFAILGAAPAPAADKKPKVLIETSMGDIEVELFQDKAPVTVKNFLSYVDDKFYDGVIFHRVISNFMIQGGGMEPGLKEKKTKDEIKNEADNRLSNERGTIAMARKGDPDSASAQFFINVADNSKGLDHKSNKPEEFGYCVFGKVTKGMDVVDKIKEVETQSRGGHRDVPVKDVVIKSIRQVKE
jgi:cyclophilin family peptidyl-prolyl cis-trans isomerase